MKTIYRVETTNESMTSSGLYSMPESRVFETEDRRKAQIVYNREVAHLEGIEDTETRKEWESSGYDWVKYDAGCAYEVKLLAVHIDDDGDLVDIDDVNISNYFYIEG